MTGIVREEEFAKAAEYLARAIRLSTGLPTRIEASGGRMNTPGMITLARQPCAAPGRLNAEGYVLEVKPGGIRASANHSAGMLHAVRTLLQLLPPEIFSSTVSTRGTWGVPCGTIRDEPRFRWRGFMLDVARHFFTPEEAGKMLRSAAMHKINRFHLHLTDDQGWRIEIKAYPRLAKVGAWRSGIGFRLDPRSSIAHRGDGSYGGCYSHDEIRELVRLAAEEHVTLIPEIEMPGHASAALAAYPHLSCGGKATEPETDSGVFSGIFCAGNEETFHFLETVLAEVMSLFPGEYIHVGGDEVPKRNWRDCPKCQARMKAENLEDEEALQAWFLNRIERFIHSKGRRMITWSEGFHPSLSKRTLLMDWIGGGREAALAGHEVIMCPVKHAYFDRYQSKNRASEPRSIGGWLPIERVYEFEVLPRDLPNSAKGRILGGQANLWTEYIPSLAQAEYMVFPRMCAMAEALWSGAEARDFGGFERRLQPHLARLKEAGIKYRAPSS